MDPLNFLQAGLPAADFLAAAGEASAQSAQSGELVEITDKFGLKPSLLVAQGINFVLVMVVLWKFAIKPVTETMEERQKKIADGLQYADEMKAQLAAAERERSEKLKEAASESQRILAESRDQAKEVLDQKTQEASAQAETILRKAREAAEQERQQLLAEARKEVGQLVVATSSRVLDRELSDEERDRFANTAARELASTES